MKKCFLSLLMVLSLSLFAHEDLGSYNWVYYSFDDAMQLSQYPKAIAITPYIVGLNGEKLYSSFKQLYDTYNLSVVLPSEELKIPKIIHMVWLGSPVPEAFQDYIDSWIEMHRGRGWRFKLWTDDDLKNFTLINQSYYDETDNYGVKSDLLKWEIIYHYGGVYVDVDFECYQPLDVFHYTHDFYTGIQPLDSQYLQLGAALFGGRPGHPILKHCIETIKDDWSKRGAPAKSGPIHFTKSFFAVAGQDNSADIAYPAHYFYPLGCQEKELKKELWLSQGVWAIHHWAKSWMPKKYRLEEFQKLNNDHLVNSWND